MLGLRTHFILLCIVTGYFVTVEARNFLTNNEIYSNYIEDLDDNINREDNELAAIIQLLKTVLLKEKLTQKIEKQKINGAVKKFVAKLLKIKGYDVDIPVLRDESRTVRDFLNKLNNFLQQNSNNNNHSNKRNDCHFGFTNPDSRNICKRDKLGNVFTGGLSNSFSDVEIRLEEDLEPRRKYAQHMIEVRARSDSSSSDSDSTSLGRSEDTESSSDEKKIHRSQKSRFQVVNNVKGKREKRHKKHSKSSNEPSSSEEDKSRHHKYDSDDDKPPKGQKYEQDSDDNKDKSSSEERVVRQPKKTRDDSEDSENERPDKHKRDDDMSAESNEEVEKFMYLQAKRIQDPNFRSAKSSRRDHNRLPHFLPKKYKWEPNHIDELDNFWNSEISLDRKLIGQLK